MPEVPRKKQVLFVDDDPLVLQGLQRMLRGMRNEWDMEFVDGGVNALALMAERPFEVVVSDMRMPGMNGAELFNAMAESHPETIRIILSGHADQDLITQCLGTAHQYLTKPCDADLLKKVVNFTCDLGARIPNKGMKRTLGRIQRLPSLPANVHRLNEAMTTEGASAEEFGGIISQDIGMTAKVLKLVNSAFFGLRREVSNPYEAATFLGAESLRFLVQGQGIFEEAVPFATRRIRLDDIFTHGLSVAQGAKAIMRSLGASVQEQNEAYTGGLLQDVGTLILACHLPEPYDEVLSLVVDHGHPLPMAEQQILGVNHADLGAYLVGLWGLPASLVQSVQCHHHPSRVPDLMGRPTPHGAVHLAEVFASRNAAHPAFAASQLDEEWVQQPWLAGRMDELGEAFRRA